MIHLAVSLCLVASVTIAQPATPTTTTRPTSAELNEAYRRLTTQLDTTDDRSERITLLREFIADHERDHPTADKLLRAGCRVGTELLTAFEPTEALAEFERVLVHAPVDAPDLRGRASYGVAQALELLGQRKAARDALRAVIEQARGTRYARYAAIASRRLERNRSQIVGSTAPDYGPRLDIEGRARQLADLAGTPALVAFLSPTDADGLEEFADVLRAARDGGLQTDQGLVFAMPAAECDVAAVAAREAWGLPVIECPREFLDEAAMAFGVRALPATYLLGPDGTIVARDVTAVRAEEIVRGLR